MLSGGIHAFDHTTHLSPIKFDKSKLNCTDLGLNLIECLLNPDTIKRINVTDALNHTWFIH